jgi:hypothetical protein
MTGSSLKARIAAVFSSLVILAGVLLIALQWGNEGDFSLYGKNIPDAKMWLIMLASAAGGLVLYWMFRLLLWSVAIIWKDRRQAKAKQEATA